MKILETALKRHGIGLVFDSKPIHIAAALVAFAALVGAIPARAQNSQLTSSAAYVYGDRFVFRLEATTGASVRDARLTVEDLSRKIRHSEAATLSSGDSRKLEVVVSAQTLGVGPFARLAYYWEGTDQTGAAFTVERQTLFYEDTNVPWQWTATQRDWVVAHTDGRDPAFAQRVLDIASDATARAYLAVGASIDDETHVYVYPELTSMSASLRAHRMRIQDWVAAYALPTSSIIVVAFDDGPDAFAILERDVAHEAAHLAVRKVAGSDAVIPGWLNEGIALHASRPRDSTLADALNRGVNKGVLLSLNDLCAPAFAGLPPQDAALAYAQSESLVRYVTERYGTSQVNALVASAGGDRTCDQIVNTALGIGLSELETQWHAELVSGSAPDVADTGSITPWIVAWVASALIAALFLAPTRRATSAREPREQATRVALQSNVDQR